MKLSKLSSIVVTKYTLSKLNGKFNSKLNFYKLIPYLVDRCICQAPCRSRQTLEKNVLSWALAGTVVSCSFARWLYSQPAGVLRMRSSSFCCLP